MVVSEPVIPELDFSGVYEPPKKFAQKMGRGGMTEGFRDDNARTIKAVDPCIMAVHTKDKNKATRVPKKQVTTVLCELDDGLVVLVSDFAFTYIIKWISAGFHFDLDCGRNKMPFPVACCSRNIDGWVCDCNVRFGGMIGVAERQKRRRGGVGERRFSIRRERLY